MSLFVVEKYKLYYLSTKFSTVKYNDHHRGRNKELEAGQKNTYK